MNANQVTGRVCSAFEGWGMTERVERIQEKLEGRQLMSRLDVRK